MKKSKQEKRLGAKIRNSRYNRFPENRSPGSEGDVFDCKHCAACCTNIRIGLEPNRFLKEFLTAYWGRDPGVVSVQLSDRCKQLTEENMCKIFEDRPQMCRGHRCKRQGS